MKSLVPNALLFAALVLGALILWMVVYNFQDRLSDRELISIAAASAAKSNVGTIAFASAEEMLSSNPGCCIVRHSNHEWLRFPARLYEDGVSIVQMSYLIERTPKPKYYLRDSDGRKLEARGIEQEMRERW